MPKPFIFSAANAHPPNCGIPPRMTDDDQAVYRGYFRNREGEQWLYEHTKEEKTGKISGGDVGWERRVVQLVLRMETPTEPPAVLGGYTLHTSWVLSQDEYLWLIGCWLAATRTSLHEYLLNKIDPNLVSVRPEVSESDA